MPDKKDILSFRIQFLQNGQEQLDLYLAQGGAVNRRGDGSPDDLSLSPAMGNLGPELFEELLNAFAGEWLEMCGRYEMPERKGDRCELLLSIDFGATETGIGFVYGSEGPGPPEEIVGWIDQAIGATDEWYLDRQPHKSRK